jgi:hypothetical protein|tara:strand:+ start:2750 stop:2962 length:213 start_codon:yes stop_codon:yes gene_type:complete
LLRRWGNFYTRPSSPTITGVASAESMINLLLKDIVTHIAISVVSVAYLGVITLIMLRDKIKDIDVGPYDE